MADTKPVAVPPDVDVVVVAGDVCEGAVQGFARLRKIVPSPQPANRFVLENLYLRSCFDTTVPSIDVDSYQALFLT